MPTSLQRQNGLYVSLSWKIWYTASGRNWTLVLCDLVCVFSVHTVRWYCSHHIQPDKFNSFPATHNIILYFSESAIFNWSTQMFSRWYLIAKSIKFWLEVDTPIFLYNHSEASVKFVDFANWNLTWMVSKRSWNGASWYSIPITAYKIFSIQTTPLVLILP